MEKLLKSNDQLIKGRSLSSINCQNREKLDKTYKINTCTDFNPDNISNTVQSNVELPGEVMSYYRSYNEEGNPMDYFCQYNGNTCIENDKITNNSYNMRCSNRASISNWFFLVLFLIMLLVLIFVIKTNRSSEAAFNLSNEVEETSPVDTY